ncbi:MAG TPA: glycosyltransferase family 4 protein [Steroidobacteraceae bacterium]|nr:glycosyltransferase family 4 protein [Steroidobacteraceae bacterium]
MADVRVAQIGFYHDPADRAPEELLFAWPTMVDVAESVAMAGADVSVIQSSGHSRYFRKFDVDYHFLPFTRSRQRASSHDTLVGLVREMAPQVLHVHGLGFPEQVLLMAEAVPEVPILLQDHANRPPRWWRRAAWKRCARTAAGVSFCAREQARPFIEAGVLAPGATVYEIPESSSRFVPADRDAARRDMGVAGDPLLLWVGHLNDNKDPLTVLDGIAAAASELPRLQLWCCFGGAPLLRQVRLRIASDRLLSGRVHLLGALPHAQVEQLMRAADFFISGSHRESTGYALIEALACGLPPIVTDIPSFRALTADGTIGQLWRAGDAGSLCSALMRAQAAPADRAAVRGHFERHLSFEALGRRLTAVYTDLLARDEPASGACPLPGKPAMPAQ